MIKITQLKKWLPEIYLLVSIAYYWVMTGTLINPIAIVLLSVVAILTWLKNRALGIIISAIFLLLNLYMVLALISELNEFPAFNKRAFELLAFGVIYLGLNIFVAIKMLIKWTSADEKLTVHVPGL